MLLIRRCALQEAAGFQDFALDLSNPDFVKYAEAYGAKGYRIREVCGPQMPQHLSMSLHEWHGSACPSMSGATSVVLSEAA